MLAMGFLWTGAGLAAFSAKDKQDAGAAGLVLGIVLLVLALRLRKRRLGYAHLWSVAPVRNERPPRPALLGERILEYALLTLSGWAAVKLVVEAAAAQAAGWVPDPVESRLIQVVLLLCMVVPVGLMRQRRLGNRYPWTISEVRRRTDPPESVSRGKFVGEVVLLVSAALVLVSTPFVETAVANVYIGVVLLASGLRLRQRRLGKPYPWSL